MLDAETLSELKILENPGFSRYVKLALEDPSFLGSLLEHANSEDWLVRWGVSSILVQVSRRRPGNLKDHIPLLLSRFRAEERRMVRDNMGQLLLHLSRYLPGDLMVHDVPAAFAWSLENGEDHERYDAIRVMENLARIDPGLVARYLPLIRRGVEGIDNPVVREQAERSMESMTSMGPG